MTTSDRQWPDKLPMILLMQLNPSSQNNIHPLPVYEINPLIQQWLFKLGMSLEDYAQLTSWDLNKLPDFFQLKDMSVAVDRIINAMNSNEKIAIFGDYDVDGTTSCALLYRFFQKIGYHVHLYQPSRFIEGYGLHPVSVEHAVNDGIKLLITVDCGTTSIDAANTAIKLGLDLIITDHHKDAAEKQPECIALINPNRRDEPAGPMQALAGVGVAFALSICIREKLISYGKTISSIYDLLPYVLIGTISDLAALNAMNLILCRHGLKALLKSHDLGLKRFLEKKEISLEYPDSEFISFYIGPMINSKGRLDHPEIALQLLTANQPNDINRYFETLLQSNGERKQIQNKVFEEAKKDVQLEFQENQNLPALIVYRPDWHEGVIGIVASKLVEEFKRPALIFTNTENKEHIKASIRTALGIDIFNALKSHEHFFVKFGGHKAAAGLTLEKNRFNDFKKSFMQYMNETIAKVDMEKQSAPILEIDFSDIDGRLLSDIYKLAPFGQGNPMPKWRISGVQIQRFEILKEHHIKWHFVSQNNTSQNFTKSLSGITFNFLKKYSYKFLEELNENQQNLQVDAWIKVNQFRGNCYIQLHVDQIIL